MQNFEEQKRSILVHFFLHKFPISKYKAQVHKISTSNGTSTLGANIEGTTEDLMIKGI